MADGDAPQVTDQKDTAKRRAYWRKELRAAAIGALMTWFAAIVFDLDIGVGFVIGLVWFAVAGFAGAVYRLEKYGPDGPPRKRGWLYRGANRVWHFGWRVFHRQDAARDLRLKNRTPAS